MIEEQQRHQYLEALGISSWLPRTQLPGSAPSADWVWDFSYPAPDIPFAAASADSPQIQHGKPAPPVVDPSTARAQLARSFGAEPAAKKVPAPLVENIKPRVEARATLGQGQEAPEAPVETITAQRPQPRFKLAFSLCGDLLLVDSLPPQSSLGFSNQHRDLAEGIVKTLPGQTGVSDSAPFLLPWPMFASPTLSQSYDEALLTVQHKLDRLIESNQIKAVLLLGESAAQMGLEREEGLDALRGILFTLRADVKALASHSLTEALQVPGIKKVIWRDLQPLLKHLSDV